MESESQSNASMQGKKVPGHNPYQERHDAARINNAFAAFKNNGPRDDESKQEEGSDTEEELMELISVSSYTTKKTEDLKQHPTMGGVIDIKKFLAETKINKEIMQESEGKKIVSMPEISENIFSD